MTVMMGNVSCYTTEEVMKMFMLNHNSQVSNLIKRHGLPYVKMGKSNYFVKKAIDQWFMDRQIVKKVK